MVMVTDTISTVTWTNRETINSGSIHVYPLEFKVITFMFIIGTSELLVHLIGIFSLLFWISFRFLDELEIATKFNMM